MSTKLEPVIKKYYYSTFFKGVEENPDWVHVPSAIPIALAGYENIDMFIVKKETKEGKLWRVSEAYTGFRLYVSEIPESKADALANLTADMNIKGINSIRLKELINSNVKKYGLSPRYKK